MKSTRGEDWSFVYTHKDAAGALIDLTGYTARMAVRPTLNSSLAAYLSTGSDAVNGSIALGGVAGTVTLSMTAADSAKMADEFATVIAEFIEDKRAVVSEDKTVKYIYDLELVSGAGAVTRALQGCFYVNREVTT